MEKLENLEKVFLPSYFPFLGSPGHDQPGFRWWVPAPKPLVGSTKKMEHYPKTVEKLEKLEKVLCPRIFPFWVHPDVTSPGWGVPASTPYSA